MKIFLVNLLMLTFFCLPAFARQFKIAIVSDMVNSMVTSSQKQYRKEVCSKIEEYNKKYNRKADVYFETFDGGETFDIKLEKIVEGGFDYVILVGVQEFKNGTVFVMEGEKQFEIPIDKFINYIEDEEFKKWCIKMREKESK